MNYQEARSQIQDGDLIAVEGKVGLAPITHLVTRSPYTHVGIAVWLDEGLWLAEIDAGSNHLIPLSQLQDLDFSVFEPPVEDRKAIRSAILDKLRVLIPYSIPALVIIGLLDLFKLNVFLHARKMIVCSGFCVEVYEAAGWGEHTRLESPGDLTDELKFKFRVEAMK